MDLKGPSGMQKQDNVSNEKELQLREANICETHGSGMMLRSKANRNKQTKTNLLACFGGC